MDKKINGLEDLKNFENSEVPTIKLSEVFQLIKKMEDTLDIIANEDQYDGFDAALDMVKRFFLGDWKIDEETGDIVTTFMDKETSKANPYVIKFINGIENRNKTIIQHTEYLD